MSPIYTITVYHNYPAPTVEEEFKANLIQEATASYGRLDLWATGDTDKKAVRNVIAAAYKACR